MNESASDSESSSRARFFIFGGGAGAFFTGEPDVFVTGATCFFGSIGALVVRALVDEVDFEASFGIPGKVLPFFFHKSF